MTVSRSRLGVQSRERPISTHFTDIAESHID